MTKNDYSQYPEILSLKQACEILNCHPNTLRNWDKKGILVPIRFGTNPNRAQVIAKISEIREDLITGRGGVYKINSLWDDGDAPEYMDALANTLSAYED